MSKKWQQLSSLIVGCGSIGKRHGRVLQSLGVGDIRACDPLSEMRSQMSIQCPCAKIYESFEDALADCPDTVFICTPPKLHISMIIQALNAGCDVFCEKPLSVSTEGIDDLETLVKEKDKKVMVGLCFRYHDGIVKAQQYLQTGRFGRIVSIRALMGEHLPDVRPDYHNLFSAKYGGAFDLMHDIDLALWFADKPVRKVRCFYGNYSDIGIQTPDLAEILINFEGNCLAGVHLDFFQRPRRRQFELICTKGVIIVEFSRWDVCKVSTYEAENTSWRHEDIKTERDDMFRAEDTEFLKAVAEDGQISCTIAEARESLEVVCAARQQTC